ncbi:MAG TPA: anthranilate phosphoribosyltransferase [Gammaproteobacteria bacterium]
MSVKGNELLERLLAGQDLDEATAAALLRALASAEIEPALAGGLLVALRRKGESAAEIRGFAQAMRELARRPDIPADGPYVDVVGTGGDRSGSLNLSTGAALLAAACGARVVKHGNRSVSSRCGSADVLQALGLPVPLEEQGAGRCLEALGFTFLFAPHYHPAMKHIAPVRAALGVRTVFNILGPLANPASPPFHVIGAYSDAVAALMAETLSGMACTRAFVIHGADGWDEATPMGPFVCYEVTPGRVTRTVRDPRDYGIERCNGDGLVGGDAAENARRLRAALEGGDTAAHRDALALGAALALEVTGLVPDTAAGVACAREAIADGRAARLLERLDEFARREAA